MSLFKLPEVASVPMSLYKSLQGRYFVGYADNLSFGRGTNAWAGLFNPCESKIKLFVNVITVTGIGTSPIRAQIWFNTEAPGEPTVSELVTPSNTSLTPLPKPKVKILEASMVTGEPKGGIKAFVRRSEPEITVVFEEDGKYIFKACGNLVVFLSAEDPNTAMQGRVAFGWWEDKNIPKLKKIK
ncbi:MAG: DUF6143 family protein [Ignavibacteriales bacterium]